MYVTLFNFYQVVVAYWLWSMQLSTFHQQDQPDLMVKYDLVTETLLTNQLHVLYESLPLLFAFQLQLLVICLLLLTKGGILAITLYYKSMPCT